MFSKESEDFAEVLGAWAKVIGVNLDREPTQIKYEFTSKPAST